MIDSPKTRKKKETKNNKKTKNKINKILFMCMYPVLAEGRGKLYTYN